MNNNRLFFNWVNYVEIEISSLCNRKCDYCPSSKSNRIRELLPKEFFLKIITELQSIDYSGNLAFHQYNEPLLEFEYLIECIRIARTMLPEARLLLYTNGDFLTQNVYELLIREGINEMHISCHLDKDETWSKELADKKIESMKRKIGLRKGRLFVENNRVIWCPGKEDELLYKLKANKLKDINKYPVLTYILSANFCVEGSNRMSKLDRVEKTKKKETAKTYFCPCILSTLNISYKGNCYLCWDCCEGCNTDMQFCVGNIDKYSIFDLYRSKFEFIQKYLSEDGLSCCENCFWNNI